MNLDPLTSREQAEHEDSERLEDWARAQHRDLLEHHAIALWTATDNGQRSLLRRLELLAHNAEKVQRAGGLCEHESEFQLDLLLTAWGAGKLMGYFSALAETASRAS